MRTRFILLCVSILIVALNSCNIKVDKRAMSLKSDQLLATVGGERVADVPPGALLEPLEMSDDGNHIKVKFGEQSGWLPVATVATGVSPGVVVATTDLYRDPVGDDQPYGKIDAGSLVGVGATASDRVVIKSIAADGSQIESWVAVASVSTDAAVVAQKLSEPSEAESSSEVAASDSQVGITPGSQESVEVCVFKDYGLGDCAHYEFDCGDLGDYNPAFEKEEDKQLWLSLTTDDEAANPEMLGKTFEIRTKPGIGYVCNEGQGGQGETKFIVGFRIVDPNATNP